MRTRTTLFNRVLSLALAICMIALMVPTGILPRANAAGGDSIIADAGTIDAWKHHFGEGKLSTEHAGGIWTDKSVFTSATNPFSGIAIERADRNFLISLSALASNKSITGYSHIPTDTILILDISNSMITAGAVDELVAATNDAITRLLALNNYNRVGVVLYSSQSNSTHDIVEVVTGTDRWGREQTENINTSRTILLPLDRYTASGDFLNLSVTSNWGGSTYTIRIASGVENSDGPISDTSTVAGGTFIQAGLDAAMDMLLAVEDTTIEGEGFQAGTKRMPVMVLMSDGAPTWATTTYADVLEDDVGNGSDATNINAFLTQLTAAFAKAKVEEHYDNDMLLYTLGLGVGSSEQAISVLDPVKSNSTINGWWRTFLAGSGNVALTTGSGRNQQTYYVSTNSYITEASQQQYATEYFEADNAAQLNSAFGSIVSQIILQSLYYPTLSSAGQYDIGGYIEFIDDLGEYMEVIQIEGIQLGDTLFTGAELSKNFVSSNSAFGTLDNPTALGDEFVWAIQARFGIENVQDARDLIQLAFNHGQLSYNTATGEFSNYIGWYADASGKYISFYNEGTTTAPANAVYTMKSYGMLGEVKDGYRDTDMMYITIQVREEISTGKLAVVWKVPASLIPVVSYNISLKGDSIENATDITMTVDSADPIRLIYEVGLRSDINALNISEKITAADLTANADSVLRNNDGSFSFLTNRYDLDAFNDRNHESNPVKPTTAVNAIAFFEPSIENERYYYTENSTVYIKSGTDYTKYTGTAAPDPNGEYYRAYTVFTIVNTATGEAVISTKYERISPTSLKAAQLNGSGSWYIPKGTILRLIETDNHIKDTNTTGTLEYAFYPSVEHGEGTYYYVDMILGNNGKLTMTPATGLKLSKAVDETMTGTTESFTFTITANGVSGSYPFVHYAANGTQISPDGSVVLFNNGVAHVTLNAGESIYIVDLPTGSYTVTEETTGKVYKIKSINGTEGLKQITLNVASQKIEEANFVNTLKTVDDLSGNLVISKTVSSPSNTHPALAGKDFLFEITLSDASGAPVSGTYNTSSGQITVTGGKATISLKAGASLAIYTIPAGTKVTAVELLTSLPGFKVNGENPKTTIIGEGTTSTLAFVNDYEPADGTAQITLTGTKYLTGRDWLDTDAFTVQLQTLTNGNWNTLGQATLTKSAQTYDLSSLLPTTFATIGTTHYRILEVAGSSTNGITYDNGIGYFDIVVSDTGMSGKLDVAVVSNTGNNKAAITGSGSNWNVVADFGNSYKATGSDKVTITIGKELTTDDSSITAAGFTFGLYNENGVLVATSTPTVLGSASNVGSATLQLTYGANFVGRTMTYTLKEIHGTDPHMIYSTQKYTVTVTIEDLLDGRIEASYTITDESGTAVTTPSFTNTYDLDAVTVPISGIKHLTGRNLNAGEFSFQLFNADSAGNILGSALQTVTNGANGVFTFRELEFNTTGQYHYVVKEVTGQLGGITYNTDRYLVTIDVANDHAGSLTATTTVTNLDDPSSTAGLVIENAYNVSGTTQQVSIDISKLIATNSGVTGISKAGYTFALFDSTGAQVGNTVTTDANGKATVQLPVFTAGQVQPGAIINFTLAEIQGNIPGISYSQEVYNISVEIIDDLDGTISAKVIMRKDGTYHEVTEAQFTNTYDPEDTTVTISGNKKLTGRELQAGEFTFGLFKADASFATTSSTPMLLATNNADGTFTFTETAAKELTFSAVGKYYFVVLEKNGGQILDGITYASNIYHITVEVTDSDIDGQLEHTVLVNGSTTTQISYENFYNVSTTGATLTGTKVLDGRDLKANEFNFLLYALDSAPQMQAGKPVIPAGLTPVSQSNDASGSFSFTLAFPAAGDYYYLIVEEDNNVDRVEYDTNSYSVYYKVTDNGDGTLNVSAPVITKLTTHESANSVTFTNIYTPVEVTVTIGGHKDLTGRDMVADEFQFGLYDADNATGDPLLIAKNDINGDFSFAETALKELTFTATGTYKFIVKEVNAGKTVNGVTYDDTEYEVIITVTNNKATGMLEYTMTVDGSATTPINFTNTYAAVGTGATLTGTKVLDGRDLKANEFNFLLYALDSAPQMQDGKPVIPAGLTPVSQSNDASGSFSFTLDFPTAGDYFYLIIEEDTNADRVTYDTTVYAVYYKVEDMLDGTLKVSDPAITKLVTSETAGSVSFTNIYTPKPDDITVDINITKLVKTPDTITAGSISPAGFKFKLETLGVDGYVELVSDGSGKAVHTLNFTEDDIGKEFIYKVTEINDGKANFKYSEDVYSIVITVSLDAATNKLVAAISQNGEAAEAVNAVFMNTYTPPVITPPADTADDTPLALLAMLMFFSASAMIVMLMPSRKKARKAN